MYNLALGGALARARAHTHSYITHTHTHTHSYIRIKFVFYVVNAIGSLRLKHYSLPKPERQFGDLCYV